MGLKRLVLLATISACCAFADEITFQLSTTGTFSAPSPTLTFAGVGLAPPGGPPGFTGTSVGGTLALTNLGTFTLNRAVSGADPQNGETFTLNILFFVPTGINGQTSFEATLSGVVNTQQSNLAIDFGAPQHFTFTSGATTGSFDLEVFNPSLDFSRTDTTPIARILTGQITNAVSTTSTTSTSTADTPEPVSVVLLGTVMLFVGGVVRRRRQNQA